MENPTCGQCECFIQLGKPGGHYGTCRRFPTPQDKHEDDWCAEFRKKAVLKLKEPKSS
jgi:hypothetical protein